MGRRDLKLNLWLKQRPRLMLRCSKADRGILIGSFASSKHISAYWTTYQHISSCRFHLRWSWRGERRLNCFLLAFFFFAGTLAPSERLRPWTGPPVAHFEAPGPHPNENKLAAHRLHRRTHALLSSALMGKCSKRFSSMLQVAATRILAREESP